MRKIIFAILLLLIPQTSFALHDLYFRPDGTIRVIQYNLEKSFTVASGTARTAGQSLMTAANVVVTDPVTGKIAKKAVKSKITKVPGVGILGGLALAGVAVGGEALIDWLMDQDPNGSFSKQSDGLIYSVAPGAQVPSNMTALNAVAVNYANPLPIAQYKFFATQSECYSASPVAGYNWKKSCDWTCDMGTTGWRCAFWKNHPSTPTSSVAACYSYGGGTYVAGDPILTQATMANLESLADAGYTNDLNGALTHLTAAVNKMQASFDHYAKTGQATGNALLENQNALQSVVSNYFDSLDATDMTELDDQVVAGTGDLIETPEQQVAESSAPTKQNIKEAVSDAINEANTEAAGETLTPLEALPGAGEPGDKGTIAPLIDEFLEGIQSLPVVSFFTDFKNITASGSCDFTFSTPNPITNTSDTLNLSFCEYQTIFELIGSFLLLVTTIVWIRYLFEG